ncbi:MAG: hypothetical protein ACTSUE_14835 [Promethearchaeota archaeon]
MPSKFIGIRLPEELNHRLEKIAVNFNQTPNQLAKIAIMEWIDSNWMKNSDMITISKKNFVFLLNLLDAKQVIQFQDQISDDILGYYDYMMGPRGKGFSELESFILQMVKLIGRSGVMWFDQIDFEVKSEESPKYFKGMHKIGHNWSKIFVGIITRILEKRNFTFQLVGDAVKYTDKMVYLEFI